MTSRETHRIFERGVEMARQGELERARTEFGRVLELAIENGQSSLWDRAFSNRCAVDVELHQADPDRPSAQSVAELRRIVLRSGQDEVSWIAPATLARIYDLRDNARKGLFYARIARDNARAMGRRDWLAYSRNQIGNFLIQQSAFEDACAEYEGALRLLGSEPTVEQAQIMDNLGYCRLVQGRHEEGFGLLFRSLRTLRRFKAERLTTGPLLSLVYGYLEIGRLERALQHGEKAFALAEAHRDLVAAKYAHYLLGETYNQLGDHDEALALFNSLQQRFYPGAPNVPELLLAVDVRSLINLKA